MNTEMVEKLARQFLWVVRNALPDESLAEIDRLNAAETNPNVCHSHDFVDANVCMADAWRGVFGSDIDLHDEASTAIWNAAWDVAKKLGFSTPPKGA